MIGSYLDGVVDLHSDNGRVAVGSCSGRGQAMVGIYPECGVLRRVALECISSHDEEWNYLASQQNRMQSLLDAHYKNSGRGACIPRESEPTTGRCGQLHPK